MYVDVDVCKDREENYYTIPFSWQSLEIGVHTPLCGGLMYVEWLVSNKSQLLKNDQ